MTLEEEQVLGQASADLNLGPLPELELDLKCFLQEPAIMQGESRGAIFLKDPQQKTTKIGLSGGDVDLTHPIDGGS